MKAKRKATAGSSIASIFRCLAVPAFLAMAVAPVTAGTPIVTAGEDAGSPWKIRATVYGWAQGLDGDVGIAGRVAPVEIGFDDILENLDIAVMGAVEVSRDRWSIMADLNYAKLSTSSMPAGINAKIEQEQFLGNFILAYQALRSSAGRLDVYAGARLNSVKLSISLDDPSTPGVDFSGSDRKTWLDPIIGARFQTDLSERTFFRAVGDLGGFGVSSDITWQAMAGFGYRFCDSCSGLLGYRAIGTDFSDGGFSYDVIAHGLILGLEFTF